MKLTDVIRRAIVTEKTTVMREQGSRESGHVLAFEVAIGATKVDIKRAIEQLFNTKVAEVRTAVVHGKEKRQGRFVGRRPDWKKAYVRLRPGAAVPEFLEGAGA